ncbi:MAG: hypothetical protein ACAI25_07930 [Planctomycetota bacterium]
MLPPVALAGEPYANVVAKTAGMVGDSEAQALASKHGLQILNVTWEDTGRAKDSSVGDNISDLTIQVKDGDAVTCMPVIRFPNFEDKTGDVRMDRFKLLVGNERSGTLRSVTLTEYLGNIRRYLSTPLSWKGSRTSLLAPRDTHALVSAQACFLPIPREGKAEFNPVLFNYQSYAQNPAVLAILVTREGTSATVLDNSRDVYQWGQRVFFNHKGEKAMLAAERKGEKVDLPDVNLSQVLLIQVPLKQKAPARCAEGMGGAPACAPMAAADCMKAESDVESAVIGHGKVEGPFIEMADLEIERDERFPVRVTVQLYKATSNGAVNEADMSAIAREIEGIYAKAESVGSLVTEGETNRPTEHSGSKVESATWWNDFWARHEKTMGDSREVALKKLHDLLGGDYAPRTEEELSQAVAFCCMPKGQTTVTPNVANDPGRGECGFSIGMREAREEREKSERVRFAVVGILAAIAVGFVVVRLRG